MVMTQTTAAIRNKAPRIFKNVAISHRSQRLSHGIQEHPQGSDREDAVDKVTHDRVLAPGRVFLAEHARHDGHDSHEAK
jgi:hypothetical protein